jgi:hypothetical protein
MSAKARAQWAFQYYVSKGLPPHVAAGIVDNLMVESGFTDAVLSGKRLGDNNTAAFAAQWRGKRRDNFLHYAMQRGGVGLNNQLDFVLEEYTPGSRYADPVAVANRHKWMQAPDRHTAAINFAKYYERPAAKHIPGRPYAAPIDTGNHFMGMTPPPVIAGGDYGGGALMSGVDLGQSLADDGDSKGSGLASLFQQMMAENNQPQAPQVPLPETTRRVVEYDEEEQGLGRVKLASTGPYRRAY